MASASASLLLLLAVLPPPLSAAQRPPHILWWHSLGQGDEPWTRYCGPQECVFSADRRAWRNGTADMLLFYGTDLNATDLPLPRRAQDVWALLHEESPINNHLLFQPGVTRRFNVTATFHRDSDFPLLAKEVVSLEWLTSTRHLVPVAEKNRLRREQGLAPVVYLQSNCFAGSDRDAVVRELRKWIAVDSYGACLRNRQLPEGLQRPVETMSNARLYDFLARYKFALAFENYRCDDYLTEKFWRPFHIGVVPVVLSTAAAKDLAPDNHSAVFLDDFSHVRQLADLLRALDADDSAYEAFLAFKRAGPAGVTSRVLRRILERRARFAAEQLVHEGSFEAFECFLCARCHRQRRRPVFETTKYAASCPRPLSLARDGRLAWEEPWPRTMPDHALAFDLARRRAKEFRDRARVAPEGAAREEL